MRDGSPSYPSLTRRVSIETASSLFKGLGFNPLQVIDRQSPMAYLDVAGSAGGLCYSRFCGWSFGILLGD